MKNAWCEFHQRDCAVPDHYLGSTHLCSPEYCIQDQDITTLMINASLRQWQAGEENEFFDRITQPIDLDKCLSLTGMTDAEIIASLLNR